MPLRNPMQPRRYSLIFLVVSLAAGALGQILMLSAAPHPYRMRAMPRVVRRHLASALRRHDEHWAWGMAARRSAVI